MHAVAPIGGFHEPISSWLHLGGAAVALAFAPALIRAGGTNPRVVSALKLFTFSVCFLFVASGLYHMLPAGLARDVAQRLDHAAIWVLIAGTFTALYSFAGPRDWRRWLLALVWGVAAVGITLKTVFFDSFPDWLGVTLYVVTGWGVSLGAIPSIRRARRLVGLRDLVAGGLIYTVGAVVFYLEAPTVIPEIVAAHELFHVAVCIGAFLHWRFIQAVSMSLSGQAAFPSAVPSAAAPVPIFTPGPANPS